MLLYFTTSLVFFKKHVNIFFAVKNCTFLGRHGSVSLQETMFQKAATFRRWTFTRNWLRKSNSCNVSEKCRLAVGIW
jgi:hypothetical protein